MFIQVKIPKFIEDYKVSLSGIFLFPQLNGNIKIQRTIQESKT